MSSRSTEGSVSLMSSVVVFILFLFLSRLNHIIFYCLPMRENLQCFLLLNLNHSQYLS